jgi:peptide deformylase
VTDDALTPDALTDDAKADHAKADDAMADNPAPPPPRRALRRKRAAERLPVRLLGDPVLREKAAPLAPEAFDDELRQLVDDMFVTMDAEEGAGLAAPQVGVSKRVFVVDARRDGGGKDSRFALVNPRVVDVSDEIDAGPEGCLSIPGVSDVVRRPAQVTMEGQDLEGNPVRVTGSGLLGRALLHELDHLDGILFIDHLSPLKRRMLLKKYRKLQEE